MSDSPNTSPVTVLRKSSEPARSADGGLLEPSEVKWSPKSAKHDYPAARSYLSLVMKRKQVDRLIAHIRSQKYAHFKAKDLLRAAGLPLLPENNPDVAKELARVRAGIVLSPCLVIRGQLGKGLAAQIADGYHRICAANHINEDSEIPVQIIDL